MGRHSGRLEGIFTTPAILLVAAPAFVFAPDTAIGTVGLAAMERYLTLRLAAILGVALLLAPLTELCAWCYRKLTHYENAFSRRTRLVISGLISLFCLIVVPYPRGMELQIDRNDYGSIGIQQLTRFWWDVHRDRKSGETIIHEVPANALENLDYRIRVKKSRGSSTRHVFVRCLKDNAGNYLAEITARDYNQLADGLFPYQPHRVAVYAHSGLVADIDGKVLEDFRNWDNLIALTYDYDAGVIRRELLTEDESQLPEMVLMTWCGDEFGGSETVNGKTELPFKPQIPGIFTAYVELRAPNQYAKKVSNTITYEQTETISTPLPDRGEHIAHMEGNVLYDETYGFCITCPDEDMGIVEEEPVFTGFGTDRLLAEGEFMGHALMRMTLSCMERPWYEDGDGLATELDWKRYQLSETYHLMSEGSIPAVSGDWQYLRMRSEDGVGFLYALYPLSDVQYLECVLYYAEPDDYDTMLALMQTLTML